MINYMIYIIYDKYIIIHREKRKIHLYIFILYKKANQCQKHLRTVKIELNLSVLKYVYKIVATATEIPQKRNENKQSSS